MTSFEESFIKTISFEMAEITNQNIQSRIRGTLLMALANQEKHLLLSTGNKSELAVGYCTLYGDMNGGLSVIGDLYKTNVFKLCNWLDSEESINLRKSYMLDTNVNIIGENIRTKAPSAELGPDQLDTDSLPPYSILDNILKGIIEEKKDLLQLEEDGYKKDLILETFIKLKNRKLSQLLAINSRVKSPFSDYGDNLSELSELIINNIVVIIGWIFMCKWLGIVFFLSFNSIILTLSAAILICVFFVQHNYENAYAKNTKNWDILDGAILGSSNLDIPNWLNWFLADISFHSIHHLCERIPNYNLRACHEANIHLLHNSKFLQLRDFSNCFKYIIWDNKNEKLIQIS